MDKTKGKTMKTRKAMKTMKAMKAMNGLDAMNAIENTNQMHFLFNSLSTVGFRCNAMQPPRESYCCQCHEGHEGHEGHNCHEGTERQASHEGQGKPGQYLVVQ